jgi:endo-1,4-beta-xylanase
LPALHTKWPFPIGAALNYDSLFPFYPQHQLLNHFNVVGAENILKPENIMPSPWTANGAYRWDSTDRLVNLAEANGQKIRGHLLFWHEQTPEAFFRGSGRDGWATADELYTRMEYHAKTVFEKYGGRIEWWDVHNEVVGDDGRGPRPAGAPGSFSRYTQIMEAAGKRGMDRYEFVLKAFQFARQYADANGGRNVKLFLNEIYVELPSDGYFGAKHTEFLRLLDYLIANNAPIDGVGLQGHYVHDYPNVRNVSRGIDAITSRRNPRTGRNLTVHISELDMSIFKQNETNWNNLSASATTLAERELNTRLTQQGRRYREFFDMFEQKHREGKLDLVVFWGIVDSDSWLNYHPINRTEHPLLFNRNFQPKPAFSELIRGR